MILKNNESSVRKRKYFTNKYLFSLIKTSLFNAKKIGNYTAFYTRINWGMDMLYIYNGLNKLLQLKKLYSSKRIEEACKRALFYDHTELADIAYILNNDLDKLKLDEKTDIQGQLYLDF